jgi:hypothetical protein
MYKCQSVEDCSGVRVQPSRHIRVRGHPKQEKQGTLREWETYPQTGAGGDPQPEGWRQRRPGAGSTCG